MVGAIMVGVTALAAAIIQMTREPLTYVKYDCTIAEISPDFPIEVKAKCRDLLIKARKNANN